MGDDDATSLFRRTVGKVRRIEHDTIEPVRRKPPPRPRRADAPDGIPPEAAPRHDGPSSSTTTFEYVRPGLQRGVLRKLKRGQYPVTDELDLHGLRTVEAHRRLIGFLEHAQGGRLACVRIITGKGLSSPGMNPVLKPKVADWLRHDDRVAAFTVARPRDGGAGALCVLLRSRRD